VLSFKLDFVKNLVKVTEALLMHSPTMKLSVILVILLIGKQVMVALKHCVGQLELVALCLKVSCWTLQIAVKSKSVSEMWAAIWSSYKYWCFIFSSYKQRNVWVSSSNQRKALILFKVQVYKLRLALWKLVVAAWMLENYEPPPLATSLPTSFPV